MAVSYMALLTLNTYRSTLYHCPYSACITMEAQGGVGTGKAGLISVRGSCTILMDQVVNLATIFPSYLNESAIFIDR